MMTLLRILTGFAGMFLGVFAAMRFATRRRRQLPPGPTLSTRLLPPPPSPPPPPPTLYDLAGMLPVRRKVSMSSWMYVEKDGVEHGVDPKYGVCSSLLGYFLVDFDVGSRCEYCECTRVAIDQIIRKPVPDGARDLGLVQRSRIGAYCGTCGARCEHHVKLGMEWPKSLERPEPFRSTPNLLRAVEILSAESGKVSKEIRYRMLSEEYAKIQPQAERLANQMRHLHAELHPRVDTDPFRATPLESEEKPTEKDDRPLIRGGIFRDAP